MADPGVSAADHETASDEHEFQVAMRVLHSARVPGGSDYQLGPVEAAVLRDALGAALALVEDHDALVGLLRQTEQERDELKAWGP